MSSNVAPAGLADLLRTASPGATVLGEPVSPGVGRIGWNAAPHPLPAAAVACRSADDVVGSLKVARDHGLTVSVMGGGVDPFHRYVRDGGIVLDLAGMNDVAFDPDAGEVTVAGGALIADLFGALPGDRVAPTGTVTYVGVAGQTMGGGYGLLTGRLGLALDALRRVEIVLADGRVVRADGRGEPDLFWAMRGGGGGLGVVTSLTFGVTRIERTSLLTVAVGIEDAAEALLAVQDALDAHPDGLGVISSFGIGAYGRAGLALAACWSGEGTGEGALAPLRSLRGATVLSDVEGPYRSGLRADARWPFGQRYAGETRTVARLTTPVAELLVDCARRLPSPTSSIFLHDFHGIASRVASDATAFALRRDHFVVGVVAGCRAGATDEAELGREWVRATVGELDPVAIAGGYVSFLGPDQEGRAREFHGGGSARLRRIRLSADPDGMFAGAPGFFS